MRFGLITMVLKIFKSHLFFWAALIVLATQSGSLAAASDVYWQKFDEYSADEVSTQEQRARLRELAIMLRGWKSSKVSVIAYGGRISCLGEARSRGEVVRKYLEQQGIDRGRVKVIDAGHADKWLISIWVAPADVEPINTDSFLRRSMETDIKILKKCDIKKLASSKRRRA